jgi:hypothetical protein
MTFGIKLSKAIVAGNGLELDLTVTDMEFLLLHIRYGALIVFHGH